MSDTMASPYKSAKDSPSRQLLWELSQMAISDQRDFYAHLDKENDERGVLHRQALAEASAQHEQVRRTAELFREKLELQVLAERRRREEEAQREVDKQRQEQIAEEEAVKRRKIERLRKAEEERKAAESLRRAEEEAAEKQRTLKAQKDQEDARRRQEELDSAAKRKQQSEAAEDKVKQAAIAAEKAHNATLNVPQTNTTQLQSTTTPLPTSSNRFMPNPQYEQEHNQYLSIHRRLKDLRKHMKNQANQNPPLKKAMSEMRRSIIKNVGQIQEKIGDVSNKNRLAAIRLTLREALKFSEPSIDITGFLASPPTGVDNPNGPALLVYLLNIFAKAIVAQLIMEAGMKPQLADQIGTMASGIFSNPSFRWQGISLIDILIAKIHLVCPVLFGINGDEQTRSGKERLGWWKEEQDGPFIPIQSHFQRMTGLGAGFAALSLRNYENAASINPFPPDNYWRAIARISNVPPNEISQTHFIVLKGLIETSEERFLQFFGDAAIVALRHALIELPRRSPPSVASKQLSGLVDVLKKKLKLDLS